MATGITTYHMPTGYPTLAEEDLLPRQMAPARSLGIHYAAAVTIIWAAAVVIGFKVALSVLVAVGFLCCVVGLRNRPLGLLAVSTLCTLDNVTRVYLMTGGLLRWNTFNYCLLLVIALSTPLLIRRNDLHSRSLQIFICVLLLWMAFSPDWHRGTSQILNATSMLGLLVYFIRAGSDDDQVWYWVAVVNGLTASLGCLVYFIQRSGLEYMDRNAVAQFPLAALFTAAMAFRIAGGIRNGQLVLALLSAVNFAWVFLSTSRGGTLIASCCLLYMLSETRGIGRRILITASALLVALSVMSYYPELRRQTIGRIDRLFDTEQSISSRTSGRGDLALAGWRIFLEDPLGVGTGGFAHEWARISLRERDLGMERGHGEEYACHNAWVKTLAENGIPGLLAFAMFVFSYAYIGWRSCDMALFRLGLFVTVSMTAAFQVTEFQTKSTWLLASGAAVLLYRPSLRTVADPDRGFPYSQPA